MGAIARSTKFLAVAAGLAGFIGAGGGVAIADGHIAAAPKRVGHLTYLGTVNVRGLASIRSSTTARPRVAEPVGPKSAQPSGSAAVANPNPTPDPLAPAPR